MSNYGIIEPFDIDAGELDGLSPQQCFVLGVEWSTVRDALDARRELGPMMVHAANVPRLMRRPDEGVVDRAATRAARREDVALAEGEFRPARTVAAPDARLRAMMSSGVHGSSFLSCSRPGCAFRVAVVRFPGMERSGLEPDEQRAPGPGSAPCTPHHGMSSAEGRLRACGSAPPFRSVEAAESAAPSLVDSRPAPPFARLSTAHVPHGRYQTGDTTPVPDVEKVERNHRRFQPSNTTTHRGIGHDPAREEAQAIAYSARQRASRENQRTLDEGPSNEPAAEEAARGMARAEYRAEGRRGVVAAGSPAIEAAATPCAKYVLLGRRAQCVAGRRG